MIVTMYVLLHFWTGAGDSGAAHDEVHFVGFHANVGSMMNRR